MKKIMFSNLFFLKKEVHKNLISKISSNLFFFIDKKKEVREEVRLVLFPAKTSFFFFFSKILKMLILSIEASLVSGVCVP
jgi:hypothetical protein